jgi:hypothetical protein
VKYKWSSTTTRNIRHDGLYRDDNIITVISEETMSVERLEVPIFCYVSGKKVSVYIRGFVYMIFVTDYLAVEILKPISENVGDKSINLWV